MSKKTESSVKPTEATARLLAALKNQDVKTTVRTYAAAAEQDLRLGPCGQGWESNRAIKPRYKAAAEFWGALNDLI
jgi:hypothetical protein